MGDNRRVSSPDFVSGVSIVLVRPQFAGNIGAVARVMKNFGFFNLRIVGEETAFNDETRNRAKNAQSVLDNAQFFDSITDAISDLSLVVGTSGKREGGNKTAFRHFLDPFELPRRVGNNGDSIGIIFGPEGKGLLNEELAQCDLLVTIPTWPGYPILNLSHAVGIICYSWFYQGENFGDSDSVEFDFERNLDPELRKRLRYESKMLAEVMPTKEHRREGIDETLSRVVLRGLPKDDEIHRLLGIIRDSRLALDYMNKNPDLWKDVKGED